MGLSRVASWAAPLLGAVAAARLFAACSTFGEDASQPDASSDASSPQSGQDAAPSTECTQTVLDDPFDALGGDWIRKGAGGSLAVKDGALQVSVPPQMAGAYLANPSLATTKNENATRLCIDLSAKLAGLKTQFKEGGYAPAFEVNAHESPFATDVYFGIGFDDRGIYTKLIDAAGTTHDNVIDPNTDFSTFRRLSLRLTAGRKGRVSFAVDGKVVFDLDGLPLVAFVRSLDLSIGINPNITPPRVTGNTAAVYDSLKIATD